MKLNVVNPQRHPVREPDGLIIETRLDPASLSHKATGHGSRGTLDDAPPTLPDERPVTP